MRITISLLLFVFVGCAETKALRYDLEDLRERQHKIKKSVEEIEVVLFEIGQSIQDTKTAFGVDLDKQKKALEKFYSQILEQIREINRELTHTVDQSIVSIQEKTKAECSAVRKTIDLKLKSNSVDSNRRIDALNKKVTRLDSLLKNYQLEFKKMIAALKSDEKQ